MTWYLPSLSSMSSTAASSLCAAIRRAFSWIFVSEIMRAPPSPAPGIPYPLVGWAQVADVARLPDPLARRTAQFVSHADRMEPAARARVAASLAAEAAVHVSPVPPV